MFDDLTWDAILQAWPWFGAAAVVFIVAVGLFIALKPKLKRHPETTSTVSDKKDWTLTGRIDFADSSGSRGACARSGGELGFPLAQVASNTAKFVGEGQRYLRRRWF